MSAAISDRKKEYYSILESAQKGDMELAEWLLRFLSVLENAIDDARVKANKILAKHLFWNTNTSPNLLKYNKDV